MYFTHKILLQKDSKSRETSIQTRTLTWHNIKSMFIKRSSHKGGVFVSTAAMQGPIRTPFYLSPSSINTSGRGTRFLLHDVSLWMNHDSSGFRWPHFSSLRTVSTAATAAAEDADGILYVDCALQRGCFCFKEIAFVLPVKVPPMVPGLAVVEWRRVARTALKRS